LPEGTVVSSFEVEARIASDTLGSTYQARDQSTRKPVQLVLLQLALSQDAKLAGEIKAAAEHAKSLQHTGLIKPLAVAEHDGLLFIARETMAGQNASALIAERKTQGKSLSLRGVYNIIAHVCKAATALGRPHGALRPGIVWVTQSGRVKLGDLELSTALAKLGRTDLLPAAEQAYLSPEVKQGKAPDVRSDVFGVGALLYGLLTARSPLDAFVIPSQLRKDASPALDAVMMRCLAADPAQRYASMQDVLREILPLVAAAPEPVDNDFEFKLEIDVDIASSLAPPPPPPPPAAPVPASSMLPITIASESPPANTQATRDDIGDLTARLTANDGPRWVFVKDGMDHGPFTARELIKAIVDGEVLEQNLLFNMASNEKKPLGEYPDFQPFVQQYRIRRDEKEHAVALDRSKKDEKRSNAAKFAILVVSIGAIVLIGGSYLLNRRAANVRKKHEADLAALYESGQVQITGTAGILKIPTRSGARGSKSGSHSSGGGFGSYEDAMNQALELGDATKGGGERQLTSGDVAGVMNRELNRMFGCVGEELRRGGKLGNVGIDIAILGSGKVAGASVHAGSAAFQRCISGKVQNVHFPSFPAPRMGARYSFSVD